MNDRESLLKELNQAVEQTRKFGWRNYICANIVASLSVAGSIAATILSAVDIRHHWLTATIAAIPAAVLAANTTFNFERKALWHWRTTKRFEGLIRKLKYESAAEAKVSEEFSKIDLETFEGWTDFSNLSDKDNDSTPSPEKADYENG